MRLHTLKAGDFRALAVCIAIAATIWMLRHLSEVVQATVDLSVALEPDTVDSRVYVVEPDVLKVVVLASGFELVGHKLFRRSKHMTLSPEKFPVDFPRSIATASIQGEIRRAVGMSIAPSQIQPDSIYIIPKVSTGDDIE